MFDSYDSVFLPDEKHILWNIKEIKRFLTKVIKERKIELIAQKEFASLDLMSLMIIEGMSENWILDECLALIYASTQNLAVLVNNLFDSIISNPLVLDKARLEIKTVLGLIDFRSNLPNDWAKLLSIEKLKQMNYIECCIKESLRLQTPLPICKPLVLNGPLKL